jgi:hypothetical protein
LNSGATKDKRNRKADIDKEIRLSTQRSSLQKELSSLTVKVSSIDPVVNDAEESNDIAPEAAMCPCDFI